MSGSRSCSRETSFESVRNRQEIAYVVGMSGSVGAGAEEALQEGEDDDDDDDDVEWQAGGGGDSSPRYSQETKRQKGNSLTRQVTTGQGDEIIMPQLSRKSTVIEWKKRRGLLGFMGIVPELEDPYDYSRKIKWLLVTIVGIAGMIGPMASGILFPAVNDISQELHTTVKIVNISIGLYMFSLGIFPMWWSAFSERWGRRSVYIISYTLFVAFAIGASVCNSIGAFIVLRTLYGGAAAAVQAVGAGTISDVFEMKQRGKAMGIFYLGPLIGPLLGPIISGALTIRWGWRSTQWFLVVLGGCTLMMLLVGLPETLRPTTRVLVLEEDVVVDNSEKDNDKVHQYTSEFHKTIISPWYSLRFLKYPPVLLSIIQASFCFSALYFINVTIQLVYSAPPYNYSALTIGLLYIPNSIGYMISSFLGGMWSDYIIKRECLKNNGKMVAEARIAENVFFASIILPISLLIYGWLAWYHHHWVLPLIGSFLFGISSMVVFGNTTTYLVDVLPGKGSSGVALNNLFRCSLAGIAAFISEPLTSAIGVGWTMTITAILNAICILNLFIIRKWGPYWRDHTDMDALLR